MDKNNISFDQLCGIKVNYKVYIHNSLSLLSYSYRTILKQSLSFNISRCRLYIELPHIFSAFKRCVSRLKKIFKLGRNPKEKLMTETIWFRRSNVCRQSIELANGGTCKENFANRTSRNVQDISNICKLKKKIKRRFQ